MRLEARGRNLSPYIKIFSSEFSAKLRRCDLASEIAFLLMDVTVHGGEAARYFLFAQRFAWARDSSPFLSWSVVFREAASRHWRRR